MSTINKILLSSLTSQLLIGCSISPKRIEYQNTFYMGCINAYYFSTTPHRLPSKEAHNWCVNQYNKIKDK